MHDKEEFINIHHVDARIHTLIRIYIHACVTVRSYAHVLDKK
jgi:hypothetical protein